MKRRNIHPGVYEELADLPDVPAHKYWDLWDGLPDTYCYVCPAALFCVTGQRSNMRILQCPRCGAPTGFLFQGQSVYPVDGSPASTVLHGLFVCTHLLLHQSMVYSVPIMCEACSEKESP